MLSQVVHHAHLGYSIVSRSDAPDAAAPKPPVNASVPSPLLVSVELSQPE
jgi:hypothetical protein